MEKRTIKLNNNYESMIFVIDELKIIYKLHCTCGDFINRKIKSQGSFSDKKSFQIPCKHLKPVVDALIKQGYKLKKHKIMEGPDKLTKEVRDAIVERSGGICEVERCSDAATRFHRIVRGSNGGKYTIENTRHICLEHHKEIHASEFAGSKSK